MRTLITIFTKYETLAERENPYRLNNISKNAVDLSDAMNLDEIIELLKMQLNEMNISKAFLALNESNSSNINDTKIRLIYPEPKEELKQKLQFKIHEPYQFPKSLFMDTRYSLMLEVLHHSDKYFGYIFLEMKFLNIAYYDVIRLLLSNALYSVRIKKADKKNDFLLETSEINRLLKKQNLSGNFYFLCKYKGCRKYTYTPSDSLFCVILSVFVSAEQKSCKTDW